MPKLAILGASGHGKVVADIAELNGYDVVFFDDAFPEKNKIEHWPVIGNSNDLLNCARDYEIFVAIGNNAIRQQKQIQLMQAGGRFPILVHPSAVISQYAVLGQGSVVMSGATINAFAEVKCGVIVNTCAVIEHDCKLGEFCHVSPNATLAGGVKVGKCAWIGASSVVKQLVSVHDHAVIGAGSVVIRDIPERTTAVGIPAKIKKGK